MTAPTRPALPALADLIACAGMASGHRVRLVAARCRSLPTTGSGRRHRIELAAGIAAAPRFARKLDAATVATLRTVRRRAILGGKGGR